MRARWLVLGTALLLAPGCANQKFAPVSGKVTLNGKPLANATVSFNPIPPDGSIESGPSSVGITDQNGAYTLRVTLKQPGAVVGKHRVSILAMSAQVNSDSDAPVAPSAGPRNVLPGRYSEKTKLTCEVPSGGTDHADFELSSP
jgi:hypothetical protein